MTKKEPRETPSVQENMEDIQTGKDQVDSEEVQDCSQSASDLNQEDVSVEAIKEQLEAAVQKRDEYLELVQRTRADFDNFRRRNRNAVSEAYKSAEADMAAAFLPVLDNLERAVESAREADAPESLLKGIEMVIKQFVDVLAKYEVEEIPALGEVFDPSLHNAVMHEDAGEEQQSGTVIEVFQKGYKTKDKVIRYSMVKVAK